MIEDVSTPILIGRILLRDEAFAKIISQDIFEAFEKNIEKLRISSLDLDKDDFCYNVILKLYFIKI